MRQDGADAHAQEAVDASHPVGIAFGQVVVDGDHMHALAGQRVEVHRQRCHQRLALTGAHFGNLALMQCHATDQLHVKVTHCQHPRARLAHDGKRFRQQRVKRLAIGNALLELRRLAFQLVIGQGFQAVFKGVDLVDLAAILFEQPVVAAAENRF